MAIRYDITTRKTVFTGIDLVKYYALAVLCFVGTAAIIVGGFFLNTYRWGSCP